MQEGWGTILSHFRLSFEITIRCSISRNTASTTYVAFKRPTCLLFMHTDNFERGFIIKIQSIEKEHMSIFMARIRLDRTPFFFFIYILWLTHVPKVYLLQCLYSEWNHFMQNSSKLVYQKAPQWCIHGGHSGKRDKVKFSLPKRVAQLFSSPPLWQAGRALQFPTSKWIRPHQLCCQWLQGILEWGSSW